MKLDKYARHYESWRDWAALNYSAAQTLFQSENLLLVLPAAVLGHHALEMYLKSAMIVHGMTIFDPKHLDKLEPDDGGIVPKKKDCAWGHELVKLADKLEERNPAFDLSRKIKFFDITAEAPITIREGLSIFDPFFAELRYPRELQNFEDVSPDHRHLLSNLVVELRHARLGWPGIPERGE